MSCDILQVSKNLQSSVWTLHKFYNSIKDTYEGFIQIQLSD